MAYRAFYIKSDQLGRITQYLSSLLPKPNYLEEVQVALRGSVPLDIEYKDKPPDNVAVGQLSKDWIVVEYRTYSRLKKWAYRISKDFKTQVVVLQMFHDFGFHYFALYECGRNIRELAVQGVGDYPFIEEGWDSRTDPVAEARKDVEVGIEKNAGMYPRLDCESEKGFDFNTVDVRFLHQYCQQLGFGLLKPDPSISGIQYLNKPQHYTKIYSDRTVSRVRKEKERRARRRNAPDDNLPF